MIPGVSEFSPEITEKILNATDIVALIGSYIPVSRAGASLRALCPFHAEETPSLHIHPTRQFFWCFGCGKTGDAITFVRHHENLGFSDAVRMLAVSAGVEIPPKS